ncbi:MAG TPA: SIR2 family protein, partial [Pyrinomonadaceae bacterium]|nr:SIR2 family protein [Pyrinomonadaceae bacterium]
GMGYPSWEGLASTAVSAAKIDAAGSDFSRLTTAMAKKDYPQVFEEAKNILGGPKLLEVLNSKLKPPAGSSAQIYKLIARWPVPVYLTTNYDDEIQRQLTALKETYIAYSNSKDHFGSLLPELHGAIVKLHGDLRSETGLILTTSQYKSISSGDEWNYWRIKMTSIFQMNRVVVIGHSLSDQNIRHVLRAAKEGAGVNQPICWIAPDVPVTTVREYLEQYRIRVITYDNKDGTHRNLLRLIESVTQFIPPRTTVHIKEQIAKVSESPLGSNAAAPGFYVFNKLSIQRDFEEKRVEIIIAAMQSTIPLLSSLGQFTLEKALRISGWPEGMVVPLEFSRQVRDRAVAEGLLNPVGDQFSVGDKAESLMEENRRRFEHMRERFKLSLQLRTRKNYPDVSDAEAADIASDIEASLTGYFREGGLTLTTTLFSGKHRESPIPSSIIRFINEASARYGSLLMRQAFSTTSVDIFVAPEEPERDYLGRISQGFFAYHSLGVFGEVARERLSEAKDTVWLIDSNVQIPTLALAASTHPVFSDCISRLNGSGVRFFTTDKLFRETFSHLTFAERTIAERGPDSPDVIAAATGQLPYRKPNQFLEGFTNWRLVEGSSDWGNYLFEAFGKRRPNYEDLKNKLQHVGIEVIAFQNWPGFSEGDFKDADSYTQKIVDISTERDYSPSFAFEQHSSIPEDVETTDPYKKATPEAEAVLIVKREREGAYYVLSDQGEESPSWFISDTWRLNRVDKPLGTLTWQTEAFLRFASTISNPTADAKTADEAFQTILWGCAQAGLSLLDERTIDAVIDQDKLNIVEVRQAYKDNLSSKYGESPEKLLAQARPSNKYWAMIQLSNELARKAEERRELAEALAQTAIRQASLAEKELSKVARFREQMEARKKKGKRIARKQKAKRSKKKKKKG